MPKTCWISAYRAIKIPDNLAACARLAGFAIETDERLAAHCSRREKCAVECNRHTVMQSES